jgi:hypothetical protein
MAGGMGARVRKFVGGIAILVFLAAYVSAAVLIADHLPDNQLARLAYFAGAGVFWGVPLLPLIAWMNRGR